MNTTTEQTTEAKPAKAKRQGSGAWKGAALVGAIWLAYAVGGAQNPPATAAEPVAATPAAPKAKPAPKRAHVGKARAIPVDCGAYSVTFNPHDLQSRSDAIEAAVSYSFEHEGCKFKGAK